jgi:hypothetical protein
MSTSAYRQCNIAVEVVEYIDMNKVEMLKEIRNTTSKGPMGEFTFIFS